MPVGKAKVKFIGGVLDGHSTESFDPRCLTKTITARTGPWYRKRNETIEIRKEGELDSFWESYQCDEYFRGEKGKDAYHVYRHRERIMVNRCLSNTKKGTRCSNPALPDNDYCRVHKDVKN